MNSSGSSSPAALSDEERDTASSSPSTTPSDGLDTSIPPTPDDITRWQCHIGLERFGASLNAAAKAIFPNTSKTRYKSVSVLMLCWEDEDPNLPVSYEIEKLDEVFRNNFGFHTEIWKIPGRNSHAKLTQRILDLIEVEGDPKEHLFIVYYGGHARLTHDRLLSWTSWRVNQDKRCPTVQWSGVQNVLEQAESDVLILLDCCHAATATTSEGNGVTELISACAYNAIANGVGYYSFTKELTIELRDLSKRPSFPVADLFRNVFSRIQTRRPEDGRERHPAPVHFSLTQDNPNFPRSIQLSARLDHTKVPKAHNEDISNYQQATGEDSQNPLPNRGATMSSLTDEEELTNATTLPFLSNLTSNLAAQQPRILLAVRLKEDYRGTDLSVNMFKNWLRDMPTFAEEVRVEAGFGSFSSIILVSIPLSMSLFIPQDPAIIRIGPITSRDVIQESTDREAKRMIKNLISLRDRLLCISRPSPSERISLFLTTSALVLVTLMFVSEAIQLSVAIFSTSFFEIVFLGAPYIAIAIYRTIAYVSLIFRSYKIFTIKREAVGTPDAVFIDLTVEDAPSAANSLDWSTEMIPSYDSSYTVDPWDNIQAEDMDLEYGLYTRADLSHDWSYTVDPWDNIQGEDVDLEDGFDTTAGTIVPYSPVQANLVWKSELGSRLRRAQRLRKFNDLAGQLARYTYREIDYKREIRLLVVMPGAADGPLVCKILTTALPSPSNETKSSDIPMQPYTALSYTWGHGQPMDQIVICSKEDGMFSFETLCVRSTLRSALLQLRDPVHDLALWIDAICINPSNSLEKAAQIAMMHEIYKRANKICIWLGSGGPQAEAIFQVLGDYLSLQNLDRTALEKETRKSKLAMNLIKAPWFSRLWAVEELALAERTHVRSGKELIEWQYFAGAISIFLAKHYSIKEISLGNPEGWVDDTRPNSYVDFQQDFTKILLDLQKGQVEFELLAPQLMSKNLRIIARRISTMDKLYQDGDFKEFIGDSTDVTLLYTLNFISTTSYPCFCHVGRDREWRMIFIPQLRQGKGRILK